MMDKYDYTTHAHSSYIEELYASYRVDPQAVDESWRRFFDGYQFFLQKYPEGLDGTSEASALTGKEVIVRDLIQAYRSRGHLLSKTNPVRERRDRKPRLALQDFGLRKEDLPLSFTVGEHLSKDSLSLSDLVEKLERIYTKSIGFEYMHIRNPDMQEWFRRKCEYESLNFKPSIEYKRRILEKLNEAVVFENFLHTKYIGQKRFSLEGGETTIPALDAVMNKGAELGVEHMIVGMAHRGRLNVLANILGKTYEHIFSEFEGAANPDQTMGDGDVKYHMGYSSVIETPAGKKLSLNLAPNPSHLEAVDAVVIGMARAKIDEEYKDARKVLPVLVHGDAAIAGQGLLYELVQMSKLPAYETGGSLHLVINNQIGFTTDFDEARSSIYCTDVAKVIDAPVLHVNGDDPEAVVFCIHLAVEFRQKFGCDVFVDMVCYRRHGHNESDEPKFTQPSLYKVIAEHPNPREVYNKNHLMARGDVDAALAKGMDKAFRQLLQDRLQRVREKPEQAYPLSPLEKEWSTLRISSPQDFEKPPRTAISQKHIKEIGQALNTIPKDFKPIKQIEKVLASRKRMIFEDKRLNWATAELLAYGSLLLEGRTVRVVGQDTQRGTFSHRHAIIRDAATNAPYNTLQTLSKGRRFMIYNSLLSEYGALGFEHGYSLANPHALVVWEAQFGDFANGAQVIIDQFIAASYTKWQRMSGLVLLLPHGYEGQGPEHSNARPERFLQLASGYNMFVCNLTEAANFFHMLRRQLLLPFRMPCVLMSPKSLFRHPGVDSPLKDFMEGSFQALIDDRDVRAKEVKKVMLCSGKVYYDLRKEREERKRRDVALVRIEQLYPLPRKQLLTLLKKYGKATVHWVQEEPENMGAWSYMLRHVSEVRLGLISRKAAASPATGHYKVHVEEQKKILDEVFV